MKAVMLAAGRGARLGDDAGGRPKVLIEVAGESLLSRHVRILRQAGIEKLTMAVGFEAAQIHQEIDRLGAGDFIDTVPNPDFTEGSVISLHVLADAMTAGEALLLMDADVLYDSEMVRRLRDTVHANAFLMDRDFVPGDEPVKICVREGRIVEFRKQVDVSYDNIGESVGFFRVSGDMAGRLARGAAQSVAAGDRDQPYEEIIRALALAGDGRAFGVEDVTGVPWIEIDFPEDVERARSEILPRIEESG